MNLKRSLKNRIRGWLPKEPNTPNSQTMRDIEVNFKPHALSTQWLALITISTFLSGIFLFLFPIIFPHSIAPKPSPSGQISPNPTVWIILGAAMFLIILSTIALFKLMPRLTKEKSRWFRAKPMDKNERRAFIAIIVSDALTLNTFFTIQRSTDPQIWTLSLYAVSITIVVLILAVANIAAYRYSKKEKNNPVGDLER